jgi:hypothetical protein
MEIIFILLVLIAVNMVRRSKNNPRGQCGINRKPTTRRPPPPMPQYPQVQGHYIPPPNSMPPPDPRWRN